MLLALTLVLPNLADDELDKGDTQKLQELILQAVRVCYSI